MEASTAERVEEALLTNGINEVAREDSVAGTIPDAASVEALQKPKHDGGDGGATQNPPSPACRPFSDIRVGTRRQAHNNRRASDQPSAPRELTSSGLGLCGRCREDSVSLGSSQRQSSGPYPADLRRVRFEEAPSLLLTATQPPVGGAAPREPAAAPGREIERDEREANGQCGQCEHHEVV